MEACLSAKRWKTKGFAKHAKNGIVGEKSK